MNSVGKPEKVTQNRVISLFTDELNYRFLGDWSDRDGNSNIEEQLLTDYLSRAGYSPAHISAALYKLRNEANNNSRSLYANNQKVYELLRYGVDVVTQAGRIQEPSSEGSNFASLSESACNSAMKRSSWSFESVVP